MAVATLLGGCLAFDSLDSGHDIDQAFAIGYRFQDIPGELWTERFSRFKVGHRNALQAGAHILGLAAPSILSELDLDSKSVTFVPALSSNETIASEKRVLPKIAQWCAQQCGSEFRLELLSKKAHPRLHGLSRTAMEREEILDAADYTSGTVKTANVFVLDDLITRGSTLCAIAGAIKEKNPHVDVYGIALAKNDRRTFLMEYGHEYYTNDHIPSEWNEVWTRHDK